MAYKKICIMDIREIIRRYRAGQTIRSIASTMGYDRKTVRKYINGLRAKGIFDTETMVDNKNLADMLKVSGATTIPHFRLN